jgi:ferric-dicitrate binding protein FerR (iron transport regulator)
MTKERLSYLFLKYLENTCSQHEMEEFFAYLGKAKTDEQLRGLIRKVYEEIKQTPSSFIYVDDAGKLVLAEPDEECHTPLIEKQRKNKIVKAFAIAACTIIAAASIWMIMKPGKKSEIARVETLTKKITECKEQKYLLLPDSTQVWLNASSTLQFPDKFDTDKREVYLTGEAYFDVKHADKIPFLIHTKKVTTSVLGTAFNIKAYPDQKEITVAVIRGKVKVSKDDKLVVVLTKGETIKISNNTEQIIQKNVLVENIAGWQQGNLVYDNAALEDIVKDLQNVFNAVILIEDADVGRLSVTTSFSRDIGAEKALEILARLTNKKVINQNGALIIK